MKGQKRMLKLLLVVLALVFRYEAGAQGSGVVCHLSSIRGFENQAEIGKSVCGEVTKQLDKVNLYIDEVNGTVYVQSNYMQEGYDYPVKLATDKNISLQDIAHNFFGDKYSSVDEVDGMVKILKADMKVVVEPNLLKSGRYSSLLKEEGGEITNLFLKCPDETEKRLFRILNKNREVEVAIQYSEELYIKTKARDLIILFESLKLPVSFSNIKLVSLLEDRITKEFVAANFTKEHLFFNYTGKEELKSLLLQNKEEVIVLLGHIEAGEFVTRSKGKELFRISINELQAFEKENNIKLLYLGCNSAKQGAKSGTLQKFNSIDALEGLVKAKNETTVEGFIKKLSNHNFAFVLDEEDAFRFADEQAGLIPTNVKQMDFSVIRKSDVQKSSIDLDNQLGRVIFSGQIRPSTIAGSTTIDSDTMHQQDNSVDDISSKVAPDNSEGDAGNNSGDAGSIIGPVLLLAVVVLIVVVVKKSK